MAQTERYITPVYLIKEVKGVKKDEVGNPVIEKKRIHRLCALLNMSSSEFYMANSNGFKDVKIFKFRPMEYHGESQIEYNGDIYDVYLTSTKGEFTRVNARKGVVKQ